MKGKDFLWPQLQRLRKLTPGDRSGEIRRGCTVKVRSSEPCAHQAVPACTVVGLGSLDSALEFSIPEPSNLVLTDNLVCDLGIVGSLQLYCEILSPSLH